MIQILISIFLSLFFLGVGRLITQNWVIAILIGVFVLFFSIFGLGLTTAASFGDDKGTTKEEVGINQDSARPGSRMIIFHEPKTNPTHR